MVVKNSFIKKYLKYSYSWFNHSKNNRKKRGHLRTPGNKIIRSRLKKEMEEQIKDIEM